MRIIHPHLKPGIHPPCLASRGSKSKGNNSTFFSEFLPMRSGTVVLSCLERRRKPASLNPHAIGENGEFAGMTREECEKVVHL